MSRVDKVKFPNRDMGQMCLSACLALSEEKSTQHFVAKADSAGGGVYYAGSQNKHPSNMRRNTICLTTAVYSNYWSF